MLAQGEGGEPENKICDAYPGLATLLRQEIDGYKQASGREAD